MEPEIRSFCFLGDYCGPVFGLDFGGPLGTGADVIRVKVSEAEKCRASNSEITPGNRRTVGCSWCARLPVSVGKAAFPQGAVAVSGRAEVHGLRRHGRNHAADCEIGCPRPAAIRNR
jgi:hypothetical protein